MGKEAAAEICLLSQRLTVATVHQKQTNWMRAEEGGRVGRANRDGSTFVTGIWTTKFKANFSWFYDETNGFYEFLSWILLLYCLKEDKSNHFTKIIYLEMFEMQKISIFHWWGSTSKQVLLYDLEDCKFWGKFYPYFWLMK